MAKLLNYKINKSSGTNEDTITVTYANKFNEHDIGTLVKVGNYTVMVRDISINKRSNSYTTTISYGTQRILLATTIPEGIPKFNDSSFDTIIKQIFGIRKIDVNSFDIKVNLQAEAVALDGKTEVLSFINNISKVGNAKTIRWWFDLYNIFHAIPVDYVTGQTTISINHQLLDSINFGHRHYYTKKESINKSEFANPSNDVDLVTAFETPPPSYKMKKKRVERSSSAADYKTTESEYVESTESTLIFGGEIDIEPSYRIKLIDADNYNGYYIVESVDTIYNNGQTTTSITMTSGESKV